MDCLDLLIADHNRFRGTFSLFQKAHEADDVPGMASLAQRLFEDLDIHTSIEEKDFYSAAHGLSEEIGRTIDEGLQEHHVGDVLIEEMAALEPGDSEWVAKMTVLIESVEHHIDEEESELFPPVRSATDGPWRAQIGERMDARRAQRGFPTVEEREQLTVDALGKMATEQEIAGRSTMTKQDLAAAVDTR